ncbi:AraC family transcriptional regulator [Roseomonas xinghualingensis]|uniref:AraC family transcriptional regulator n=1 Tax=Roseomonas xinghualingensis TaxID=2986475 RepID=UPI0021F115EB|nr:AraC family transcriptional regulator [Roseomonas sp. SXEYE001]MCV4207020.1 AraC family transcriptional regulator [Roseomonas sp. SXEYE001]
MPLKPATRLDYGARIARSMALLARDPGRVTSLEELAAEAAFSPYHFHRIYRMMSGETPAETLVRLRLHQAASELIRGSAPVEKVARKAGYSGAASFTRAFRAAHGIPPAAYRARGGSGAVLRCSATPREDSSMHDVTIRELPPLRLAMIGHSGDYQRISAAFDRLEAWARARGLTGPETRFFGIYHDDPHSVAREALRSEAALTVPASAQGDDDVRIVDMPALRVAALRFQGPYAELECGYDALYRDWLPGSGEEPETLPAMEEYLNDCKALPPTEWLTDIMVPLKARVPA